MVCPTGTPPASGASDVLSEVLVLPHPESPKRKKKTAINNRAVCITESGVLQELKEKRIRKLRREN